MPICYRIDESKRRIYTRAEGMITFSELLLYINAEEGMPAASYSEIFDCSKAQTNITSEEIRKLAAARKKKAERCSPGAVAIVATDDVLFGMLRMYDGLTDQIRPLRVFRNLKEAERWLDEIVSQ